MIKALIFDFDGLILDTELSALRSWQEVYQVYKCDLPLEKWALCIGSGIEAFDPHAYLESLLERSIPYDEIASLRLRRHLEMIATQSALPGVEDYIKAAKHRGLKTAVASSSPRSWVVGHLTRLELHAVFDAMKFGDEVSRKKPQPEIYLSVLEQLGVDADQAIALEDSPNGVLAAQRAGIFCVAIPNLVTSQLSLDHADMRLQSLTELSLDQLIATVENKGLKTIQA